MLSKAEVERIVLSDESEVLANSFTKVQCREMFSITYGYAPAGNLPKLELIRRTRRYFEGIRRAKALKP